MAEDYLTDDEQLERVKHAIAENWVWVLAGVVLGAAIIFGYRFYENRRNETALRAAADFDLMSAAVDRNDGTQTRQLATALIRDFPASPYADQAQLVLARLDVDAGKLSDATAPLTQVMTSSKDTELRHVARLRLARVQIAEGKPDDAIATLAGDSPGAFIGLYHEVRGDALYAKKDAKGALAEYRAALDGGPAGSVNAGLVQLKIADLGAAPAPAPPTAMLPAPPPAAAPTALTNKAKP